MTVVTSNSVNRIIGNLFKFGPENDWNNYIQQMKFFFLANSIKDNNNKKAVLLSPYCSDTYKLFKNLIAPEDIGRSSYAEIKRLMDEHKNPKPNQIAEWFKFNSRNCKSNKSLSEYMAELCHLTQFCDYRKVLNMHESQSNTTKVVKWRIVINPGKSIKHCYISWISNQPVVINKPVSTASTSQQGRTNQYIQNNRK